MPPGATEPVVKVKVAEGGVEVIPPEQIDHTPSQPDAFRVAGGPSQAAGGLGKFVDLALFFGGIGGLGTLAVTALGRYRPGCQDGRETGHGQETQQRGGHVRAGFTGSLSVRRPVCAPELVSNKPADAKPGTMLK
ncbi:MAG: hypothetical protein HY659_11090 [Rhizobiales bacterium]|nr:hypothetical protein [Hyphomicrobiales bacterium]